MPEISFKISPRAMRMLGRQNVSSQFVAINELVKNAYDADSPVVDIKFEGDTSLGHDGNGRIVIRDSGSGMDLDTIANKWLTIGTDNKEKEPISPKGRVRTGAKGIGRFALDRLGEQSVIETFYSPDKPGIRIFIDWNRYDDLSMGLESVKHNYHFVPNSEKITGTRIEISKIWDKWNQEDMQELYEDLSFLIPPLQPDSTNFVINISSDDYPELNGQIEPTSHDNPEFLLSSTLSADGKIDHLLTHREGLKKSFSTRWAELFDPPLLIDIPPQCGAIRVTLRIFIGPEGKKITTVNVRDTAFKKYLKSFRGIRIYRDGFLVKPYGLKNNDWLGLGARKIRQNEGVMQADLGDYRFNNHQIIGKVDISRIDNPNLEDRTSREGLIDNAAFKDLKKYLLECITYVEMQRQIFEKEKAETSNPASPREVIQKVKSKPKKRGATEQKNAPKTTSHPEEILNSSYNEEFALEIKSDDLNPESENISDLEKVIEASEKLINENDMLRTLATLGISAITLSHELKGDLLSLNTAQKIISLELQKFGQPSERLKNKVADLAKSTARMESWADLILKRTQSRRRKEGVEHLEPYIIEVVSSISKSIEGQNLTINNRTVGESKIVRFRPIDIEAITINLLSNAVKALKRSSNSPKIINLTTDYTRGITLTVEDSGTGIRRRGTLINTEEVDIIFSPLTSFNEEDGTGMGLSIVDSICKDNNWRIKVEALNSLGGATFSISFEETGE